MGFSGYKGLISLFNSLFLISILNEMAYCKAGLAPVVHIQLD